MTDKSFTHGMFYVALSRVHCRLPRVPNTLGLSGPQNAQCSV